MSCWLHRRAARSRKDFQPFTMASQGATLQNYNNETRCEKREELNRQILKEEEDKAKIQKELSILTDRILAALFMVSLQKINESLVRKTQARNEYDKTIQETEAAYMKILESSQTLLHVLKRETVNLTKYWAQTERRRASNEGFSWQTDFKDIEADGKTELAHALEKLLRRPLTSEDVSYDTSEDINALEPSFQSSVTVRLEQYEFRRQATGHSAASSQHAAAMSLLKDWAEVEAHASQANPGAIVPAGTLQEAPAVQASEGAAAVDSDDRPADCKSILTRLMQKVLGRPVTKDDVKFQTVEKQGQQSQNKPFFQSTVILRISANEWTGVGETVCGPKKTAEQDAAWKALQECPELKPLYEAMVMAATGNRTVNPALSNDATTDIPDITGAGDETAYPNALSNDDTTDIADMTDGLVGDKRIEHEASKPATVQVVSEEVRIPHDLAELTEVEVEDAMVDNVTRQLEVQWPRWTLRTSPRLTRYGTLLQMIMTMTMREGVGR
ncbi:Sjoegren syndrome nuclear autoantigen 1-like [Symbiodinium microadriaticum]|uniref:Sjoegren syndrome nuclear autoantigen 1-like n=1 Tax=Symbiodinium microadriaticum TaxID=2951 RepID=A0A1Q9DEI9_SYMMI|nr:Sjoegren syndrome nuclear autoantigen 1-like [Symbiodinium microadriaticum]